MDRSAGAGSGRSEPIERRKGVPGTGRQSENPWRGCSEQRLERRPRSAAPKRRYAARPAELAAELAESARDRRAELAKLKKKLADEGLFALEKKRKLPRFPLVVGLVTSKEGAAMHDVIRVASGRAPVRPVVSHCQVQGAEAPLSIVKAIKRVCRLPGLEVVIVTRGGGATEDLSAFNDERVARAMAACPVPVVSGVGHEIDETIADLVADVRAATPSNAAELVV